MNELVFDIETAPENVPQSLLDELFSKIEPTQTAIKAKTEKEYIKAKQDEIMSDFALSPMTGKIIGIGIYFDDTRRDYLDGDEISMLDYFNCVLKRNTPRLISFNGKSFDAHFIKVRSAILGYDFGFNIPTKRYDTKDHFDVREVLTNFGLTNFGLIQRGTLRQWAIAFGIEPQKNTGKDLHLLTPEEQKEKCLADCRITYELFNRLKHSF